MLKSVRTQRKQKDPEGRMPLVEHLRELRNRLVKSLLAIVPLMIVGFFFAKDLMGFLAAPIPTCKDAAEVAEYAERGERCAQLVQQGLTSPFATYVKVSLMSSLVAATPVWLYQLWGFLAPGLHRSEKKYGLLTAAFGVPLFLAGGWFAYLLLPHAVPILLGFSYDESNLLVSIDDIIGLSVKMVLAFGIAFQLPLILVLLNLGGVISGRRMLGWWRGMVLGIAVFSAIVTPTDPLSMIALSIPITLFYFTAVGISLINDRRKARRDTDARLDDDEAADLDLTPEAVGAAEAVPAPRALPGDGTDGRDSDPGAGRGGLDDAT